MTPREKAVATLGHQEACDRHMRYVAAHAGASGPEYRHCVCNYPLHVLIAAERGRLRKEHVRWSIPTESGDARACQICGEFDPGPCAEPLTPALAWEAAVLIASVLGNEDVARYDTKHTTEQFNAWLSARTEWSRMLREGLEIERLFRLYLALAESGLLRRDEG